MSIGDLLRGFGVKDNGETNGLLKETALSSFFTIRERRCIRKRSRRLKSST